MKRYLQDWLEIGPFAASFSLLFCLFNTVGSKYCWWNMILEAIVIFSRIRTWILGVEGRVTRLGDQLHFGQVFKAFGNK